MSQSHGAVEVERVFIGAGCNRIMNNVSWGACNLVAFGAQNAVAIFCPKTAQILTTLRGHQASVNCTHWIPSTKFAFKAKELEQHYLLSGDANGAIILWKLSIPDKKWRYVLQVPQSHKKGVTCITGIMISQTDAVFASTSSDGTVNVWELILSSLSGEESLCDDEMILAVQPVGDLFGECKLSCLESLFVGPKAMVALSLAELPGSSGRLVLAMGGLDNKIHIYCGERTGKFLRACELKGHTDWIRSMDFSLPICINGETNNLLLVSSSQDRGIRIWKMSLRNSLANSKGKEEISLASYIEGPIFVAASFSYKISLESLLIGHEDWIYSVEWQPPLSSSIGGIECHQPQSILSASMDKTMMIWEPERTTGIWMNVVTVGELSHCALGFYGGHWSPNGDAILAHGYGGSFHLWRNVGVDVDNWQPQKVPSGHFAEVTDIAWARSGEYLLSVSHDQTTRIFAPWLNEPHLKNGDTWHEIARPQVHGHDINCVAIIQGKGNHRFKSTFPDLQANVQILGANMSALGLSQKPIYVKEEVQMCILPSLSDSAPPNPGATYETPDRPGNEGLDTLETIPDAVPVELTEPPIEEQLAWHTLWPESHKLYGHGNELFSLCCDHEGKLVASSCKAQSASVAEIWLWQVGTWKAVDRLQSHSLTVTQMEFSHDDNFLLLVSRDRQFSVFSIKRTGVDETSYQLLTRQEAHKRIIWTCSWNPFGHEFATGSRDKTVKIWANREWILRQTAHRSAAVQQQTEDGSVAAPGVTASLATRFDPFVCHVSAVHRLAWRNSEKSPDSRSMELASCGADHTVRVV
ncbi:elongator protein 2 [Actinidia rufa]|uniref:Elongator complex protein 2 n=1 Tax=Actinidia rufa TaxID=165716 RepID=A0A7J0DD76_9ERIC|nr:elongator protein 2 [Actinidia rufa]